MLRFTYNNNIYKTDGINYWIIAGENNLYVSKITDENMIEILTDYLQENVL